MKEGTPLLGLEASWKPWVPGSEPAHPGKAGSLQRPWPAPRAGERSARPPGTAAMVHRTAVTPEQLLGLGLSPFSSWDTGHTHPRHPARRCPGPSARGPGRGPDLQGLVGLSPSVVSRPFSASCSGSDWGVGPQFLLLSFILCLFSQVCLLRAWEGSGDASFCSNTRPFGLNSEGERGPGSGGPPRLNSQGPGNSLGGRLHWGDMGQTCRPTPWLSAPLGATRAGWQMVASPCAQLSL